MRDSLFFQAQVLWNILFNIFSHEWKKNQKDDMIQEVINRKEEPHTPREGIGWPWGLQIWKWEHKIRTGHTYISL